VSSTGKRARARARLVDQLERLLRTSKPLLRLLEAVGVDPESPVAKPIAAVVLAELYQEIGQKLKQKLKQQPRTSGAAKWTLVHDMALKLEVEWWVKELKKEGFSPRRGVRDGFDGFENEAIRRVAAELPPESRKEHPYSAHRFPYKQNRKDYPKSTDQERYEQTLRQRWIKIKRLEEQRAKINAELLAELGKPKTEYDRMVRCVFFGKN
jgi:hypothetical protein